MPDQRSTYDQVQDTVRYALREGMYDAADWITKTWADVHSRLRRKAKVEVFRNSMEREGLSLAELLHRGYVVHCYPEKTVTEARKEGWTSLVGAVNPSNLLNKLDEEGYEPPLGWVS